MKADFFITSFKITIPFDATQTPCSQRCWHITPEAQQGGPIALLQNGDIITIDAEANEVNVDITAVELEKRKAAWKAPAYPAKHCSPYKHIRNVKSASEGCVTDE